MSTKKSTTPKDPEARMKAYIEDEKKLRAKYALDRRMLIIFPDMTRVPLTGRLARIFLKWSRGRIEIFFVDKQK